jgi:hypothetical protein
MDQLRIICNPDDPENTKVPVMPLIVVFPDGVIGEAGTIHGATALVVGNEYLDAEDADTEWHMRVGVARREAMLAAAYDIDAVVFDSRIGIIENNYAARPGDSDYGYEPDEPAGEPVKILVDDEKLFLLSLVKLGSIKVLERSDSYLLRPHQKEEECNPNEYIEIE